MSAAIVTLIASGRVLPRYRWAVSAVAAIGFLLFAAGNYDALEKYAPPAQRRHRVR